MSQKQKINFKNFKTKGLFLVSILLFSFLLQVNLVSAKDIYIGTSTSFIYLKDTGNIGIGITNPSSIFHIKGSSSGVAPTLIIQDGNETHAANDKSGQINFSISNGVDTNILAKILSVRSADWPASGHTGADLTFWTKYDYSNASQDMTTERMRITYNGNVGIGTTAPGAKLDVNSDNILIANFKGLNSVHDFSILSGYPVGNYWRERFMGANIDIDATTGRPKIKTNASRGSAIGFNSDSGQGNIHFFTSVATTTGSLLDERMIINSAGNVGIGTTNPNVKLSILSDLDLGNLLARNSLSSYTGNIIYGYSPYAGTGIYGQSDTGIGVYGQSGSSNGVYAYSNSGTALNVKSNSGYAAIFEQGKVRIKNLNAGGAVMSDTNGDLYVGSGAAKYVGKTATTYNGNLSYSGSTGYSAGNKICSSTVVAASHMCTGGEILNTINTGNSASLPVGPFLWVSNGPPGSTVNSNDCKGWADGTSSFYGPIWVVRTSGTDGSGAVMTCNNTFSIACCK